MRRAAVLVGREGELDTLLRAVRDAATGTGTATSIVLVGEGGVGKTRLLSEITAEGRRLGMGVLSGRAPITSPLPFSVVADAFRSWLRGHPSEPTMSPFDRGLRLVLPEWPDSPGPAPELSDAQLRLLALEGMVRLVRETASANRGALVVVDDLHAADPESIEAARYIAAAAIEGVVVIGALRPGESALADELVRSLRSAETADVIELSPLNERGVNDLVAALLDSDPPDALVADIIARTDGVPLLVEEVLDAHLRAGSLDVGEGGAVWRGGTFAVPRTIRGMVEARLDRLTTPHRNVLVAGAVAAEFDAGLLAALAEVPGQMVSDALAEGIHVGLLETTAGAIGFRHAIIRDAVLASPVPHVIDALHRKVATELAAAAPGDAHALERRAHHLAAVGEDDDAAGLLTAAAGARLRQHALLGAERLARRALDLSRTPGTQSASADALAQSLAAQGRWSEALEIDEATGKEHGETPARRHRMATAALEAGRPELAGPIIARALEAGDESPFIRIADGRAALVGGDAEHAVECARRVLEDEAAGDIDARLSALDLQARAFDYLGDRAAAEAAWAQQAEEALKAGRTQAQLRAVVQLGKLEIYAGRPGSRLREAVALARDAGALVELAWAEENYAVGLAISGDPAGAAAVLDDAVTRARELGLDQLAYLLAHQAAAASFSGQPADHLLAEAEALCPTDDLRLHTVGLRGDMALREGRYEDAVRWLRECVEITRVLPGILPSDSPCWYVWALAAAGRDDEAAAALEEVRAMPDLARWHARPMILDAAEALLAGNEQGIDDAIASATSPVLLDIALMRMLGAETLRGPAQARWLREALELYERWGEPVATDRVRRLLREAGGPVPRRRRRTSVAVADELARHGVTAREAEVLQLLGDGLSNADIAQRLYLSVRTVETHVSSLLTKLDARSRGQLTAVSLRTRGATDADNRRSPDDEGQSPHP